MSTEAAIPAAPTTPNGRLGRWLWDRFHLVHDIRAAMRNDPAARGLLGLLEVVFTYSGFHAITLHRVTHLLWLLRIPTIPRVLSQINRFFSGIEIHPGAQMGKSFFIDHGMGVVIGETAVIGDHVNIFHQVTLGGTGKETGKRHPTLGSHVTVGAGAKILGNITIGDHVLIGANAVVLKDVPDHSTVVGIPGRVVRRRDEKIAPEDELRHDLVPDPVMRHISTLRTHIQTLENRLVAFDQDFKDRLASLPQLDGNGDPENGESTSKDPPPDDIYAI
jgi:serine O-acetyltransferase